MTARRFFNDVEGLPWDEVLRLKEQKLLAQLRYVATHSELYRQKFAAAGVDVGRLRRAEDLRGLPFSA